MSSLWVENTERASFPRLEGDVKCDVLVIGGGIAGLLCTYMLKRRGVDCLLIEAGRICNGITKNTTAKVTLQHGLIYDKLIKKFGKEKAGLYLSAQMKALAEYDTICKSFDCDYEKRSSYVYSLNNIETLEREARALDLLGMPCSLTDTSELPFDTVGAVRIDEQAQIHPLKLAFSLARDLPIYENTKAKHLKPHGVILDKGEITAEKIIVATHFPILNKHGAYFLKMYQHRSYVLALHGAQSIRGMYIDEAEGGLSFRGYGDVLLLGGGSHRTGKNGGGWRELEQFSKKYYPDSSVLNRFATQDCMTLDSVPYIGRYSKATPDLFVTTGFNKWGMTSAMLSAMLLSDEIIGNANDFSGVFSPSRSILHPQLAVNAVESIIGLITPTAPRCPHLGCALKYNREEHSWDCPCHGSRFTEDGELIDNPATDDKKPI